MSLATACIVRSLALVHARTSSSSTERFACPFIVGAPRSGTTLLRMMLDAHPQLAIPPETGFIVPSLKLYAATSASLRGKFHRFLLSWPREAPAWRDFGIDADELQRGLQRLEPFSVADGLRCFYKLYASRFGKVRWGDKTPRYGSYLRAIRRLLPEARFIHIIRDGRDVALSWRRTWFSPGKDIDTLARAWKQQVLATRAQGRGCPDYLEVRFESLIADPGAVLEQICSFIDLPYDKDMESYWQRTPARLAEHHARIRSDGSVIVSQGERWQQQLLVTRPPQRSRIFAWQAEMTEADCFRFQQVNGDLLRQLGYPLH